MAQWQAIADNYLVERDHLSLPAILIDDLLVELAGRKASSTIFDFGAGSGTLTRLLHHQGHRLTAYEPNPEMASAFTLVTPPERYKHIGLVTDLSQLDNDTLFDTVLCSNVFDHLRDVPEVLAFFFRILKKDGQLILSIPHPLKNIGHWVKEMENGEWKYVYYRLNDYLNEGEVKRNREDVNGNVIIYDVVSQHRTMSTYYNMICEAGFTVRKMYEPAPREAFQAQFPALTAQSSRIPYFWILDCEIRK